MSPSPLAAIVTGATSGIGAEIARRLHADGLRVVVAGRSQERGAAMVAELGERALFVAADLTEPEAAEDIVARTVEHFGTVDVLVNNAAIDHTGDLLAVPAEEIRTTLETNVVAAIRMLQSAARAMTTRNGGAIINITSRLASAGVAGLGIYSATKGAMESLTRSAAIELAPFNIRVNAVAPGLTRTPLYTEWMAGLADAEQVARDQVASIPLGRIAEPRDVAAAVSFLASPDAAYITGASLPVEGGFLAR
ncbi:SDR family NAD(P)-dependent oxidoreductase [Mycolicibacterium austroafricanum]|uniref:SDR family oxidoreductase n=1 Tax=Mycolicibacterium austroafricanum TaxID=39687 RepID=A0ABT8HAE4_MYCAO|nr:SDR family oxidoreductase [Mycolicibacterium austroafricanum]MDN4517737.1 SDR family oxidoreductase [Mycolicibacterium austroafricanum]PQP45710.1 dehydrogenase [Mycolicibacterium austroafricanum]QRZ08874.1 SDR family oxidoreductase [Mycolicibacterium austroafricanum]QZT64258.1 SDR family oxidoreductase [Mycolicibacterium austroafricanum]QZT70649.1 SDR family oxidoreductase [Mycolicibacterium austroafricanum]